MEDNIKEKEDMSDRDNVLGAYRIENDIHDNKYSSPLITLKNYTIENKQKIEVAKDKSNFWWVALIFSVILLALYCIGLYFTYYSDP